MIVTVDGSPTVEGFHDLVTGVLKNTDVKSLFILTCDANGFRPESLNPILEKIPVPVFGGIFPAVIHGKEKMDTGTIVVGLKEEARTVVIPDLSNAGADYVKIIDHNIPEIGAVNTMMVFVDGLSKRIDAFIDSLFTVFGLENNYIGGGAGSLSMKQKPCLITNRGLLEDCAVLALLDAVSGVGVAHGWKPVSGPYRVTESKQNKIKSLDWKPAFEVYKEAVEEYDGWIIDKNNFFNTTKAYPFGLTGIGAEQVVRDPVLVEKDNSLVCVGEVPEGSLIDLLKGDEHSLIRAAGMAMDLGEKAFKPRTGKSITIFIDCISRVLFLDEEFTRELDAVHRENQPLIGACTLGEIANSGNDYLEFYNKTSVAALLEEP